MFNTDHINIIKSTVNATNGEKEYSLIILFMIGNVSPTKKFPVQLETAMADIIIGLGPTSVNSENII